MIAIYNTLKSFDSSGMRNSGQIFYLVELPYILHGSPIFKELQ